MPEFIASFNAGSATRIARLLLLRLVMSVLAFACIASSASAQMVEVAPGIYVSKRTFAAIPANEQPFYGFIEKTPVLRALDAKFVAGVIAAAGTRQKAVDEIIRRGWIAFSAGNHVEAGRRFNQAYLVDPAQSSVFHGFAVVAASRLNDADYAQELFAIAKRLPNPLRHLNADFGRLMLVSRRPRDALPLLEQAVIDEPDAGTSWSNLGFARLQTGDRVGACMAATEAARRSNSPNVQSDLAILRSQSKCD